MQGTEVNEPIFFLKSSSMSLNDPELTNFILKEKSRNNSKTLEELTFINRNCQINDLTSTESQNLYFDSCETSEPFINANTEKVEPDTQIAQEPLKDSL